MVESPMRRKVNLATGEIYHVFTKSIAGYTVFNRDEDFERFLQVLRYYQAATPSRKFSDMLRLAKTENHGVEKHLQKIVSEEPQLVQIIAYCIMPTHLHVVLKQLQDGGVEVFMRKVLNSYAKYFNAFHKRKGPLWEGRFQGVRVESDEQLIHLTRYIHLNPVTALLAEQPEGWKASSYREYLAATPREDGLCDFHNLMDIQPEKYRQFVKDRISYQQSLARIKKMLLD
jgi:putative transposase